MTAYEKAVADYRALLTKTEQESQGEYDKTVLALSGGALGLSFAFINEIVSLEHMVSPGFLLTAWIGWGLSSTSVLLSFFFSHCALRKSIIQLDAGKLPEEHPGGWFDRATAILNLAGLCLFLFGLIMMIVFLCHNLGNPMPEKEKNKQQALDEGKRVPLFPADKMQQAHGGKLVPTPPANIAAPVTEQPQPQPASPDTAQSTPPSPSATENADENPN